MKTVSIKPNPVPKYIQIRNALRHEIRDGTFSAYSKLPSEKDLAHRFEVSVLTVRQAISELVNEGLVEKSKGRQSMVCPPKATEPIFVLPHDNRDYGIPRENVVYKMVYQDLVKPSNRIREKLHLSWTTEEVIRISRVRYVNEKPVSFYYIYLNYQRCASLLKERLGNKSLVKTMRDEYSLIPKRIQHEIEVLPPTTEIAHQLKISEKHNVLLIESVEYDENDTPFSYYMEFYRADRHRFQINLSIPGNNKSLPINLDA